MVAIITQGSLDALLGVTFAANSLVNASPTLVVGTITNTVNSPDEVLTYSGLTATIGSPLIAMNTVTYKVTAVSDVDDTLTLDAYVGTSLVAILNFTVAGFSGEGIALVAMPLAAMVSQASNLSALAGSLFVLGMNSAAALAHSTAFTIGAAYAFFPNASVHYINSGHPVFQTGHGPQMVIALTGNDTITGGAGRTVIYGGPGNDVLTAGTGHTFIYGGSGNDTIVGGAGSDLLTAGSGTDTLYAGTGYSVLVGGDGNDRFVFAPGHCGGLTPASGDGIQHFRPAQGDLIDLSAFDVALPIGGSGHLNFIGTAAFDGKAGEVRYDVTSSGVSLQIDMTGSGTAQDLIQIKNTFSVTASNFVL